jgi:serine phosphatase RsbU (regulator of sigma subunit)
VDVTLGAISTFLRNNEIARRGHVSVIDEQGLLVASSEAPVSSPQGQRIRMDESSGPVTRAIAASAGSHVQPLGAAGRGASVTDVRVVLPEGDAARLNVATIEPYAGIAWRLVVMLPEREFLTEASESRRRAGWIAAIGIGAVGLLAVRLAGMIAAPIRRLRQHVRAVGQGDFETRLELRAARELSDLSDDLNRMSGELKQHMELRQALDLAMQIQQSLLPKGPPVVRGLDVAGVSKYCDTTGGDYYDFVEMAEVDGRSLVVAVGDVMGHGIAAALLMATARAALRSSAATPKSLGVLMNRVNEVLCRDTEEVQFMTMLLLVAEPGPTGKVRWASAGHDPAILFDSRSRRIRELDGADLPLGIVPGTHFHEFSASDVAEGSILLIGTDGVWEALNASGEPFGKERLHQIMTRNAHLTAGQISAQIEQELAQFIGDVRPTDDVTFVVVKITAPTGVS